MPDLDQRIHDALQEIAADVRSLQSASGLTRTVAQIRNNVTVNVNQTNWTTVPLSGTVDRIDASDFVVSGNGIQCLFAGWVKATAHLSIASDGARTNPIIRLAGPVAVPGAVSGKSGYIRAASGHNESSVTIPGVEILVAANEVITVESKREGGAAAATMDIGGCYLFLERFA